MGSRTKANWGTSASGGWIVRMRQSNLLQSTSRRGVLRPFTGRCCAPPRPAASLAAEAQTAPAPAPSASDGPHFKANIDFKFIKDNLELVVQNAKDRSSSADPRLVVQLYDQYVQLKQEADHMRAERNENSSAMKGKLEADQRQKLIQRGQELKDKLAVVEDTLVAVELSLQREGQRVPNLTHPSVPIGGEELATVLSLVGEQRRFEGFEARDHVTIAEALDLVDFEAAAEVSGQKFYYLRNAAALLELALVNWAITKVVARGFTPIMTPDLVKESVLEKCGFQPRGTNTQVYSVQDSSLCLTGTAEVPLGGLYMDKLLNEADLPVKMAAYGHCFRTEAGAGGAAGKGLYRVHQFSKVEMFVLSTPEQSDAIHQELIDIETGMFSELGLHFKVLCISSVDLGFASDSVAPIAPAAPLQVLDMSSADLGAPAYRKFDVEAWMPGLKRYGEISSASNCTDYQSRRLNIRYRPSSKESSGMAEEAPSGKKKGGKGGAGGAKTEFVHTLNATACAVPRMIVAILENFQQADGSVIVPEVLRPFMGGMAVILPPVKH